MKNEFDTSTVNIHKSITNLLNNWWKITLFAMIFGLLGLGLSYIQAPKYEAEAIFSATIDYRDINFENLVDERQQPLEFTQYEVDLALSAVQRSLLKTQDEALVYAQTLDQTLTADQFESDSLIERMHDRWYLRFRHEDPEVARKVVNTWVDLSLEQLAQDQADELVEPYVINDLIAEAELPSKPDYQNRNYLILAGIVIGFVVGVWVVDFNTQKSPQLKKA